jgi:hypothetical protein
MELYLKMRLWTESFEILAIRDVTNRLIEFETQHGKGRLSAPANRCIQSSAGAESFVCWSARFVGLVAVTGGVGF